METESQVYYPVIVLAVLLGLALVGWLIYRNMKDEKEFEQDMDDPKRDTELHHTDERT